MKRIGYSWVWLAVLILVACATPVTSPPSADGSPTPRGENDPISSAILADLRPRDVLVQQDYEPGLLRPEVQYPFGRVAPFTLYADGMIIFLEGEGSDDQQRLMQVQLAPQEAVALLQQVLDLGFGRLENHTDPCRPTGEVSLEGESIIECVMDASTAILRARLPTGELKEVKVYGGFANDPQAFLDVRDFLSGFERPEAKPYVPAQATLFLQQVDSALGVAVMDWPLDPQWLAGAQEFTLQARLLEGENLAHFLAAVPRNQGDFWFQQGDHFYNAYLVPWLPGADYRALVQEAFPQNDVPAYPPPAGGARSTAMPTPEGQLASCPWPQAPGPAPALRLAFVQGGDLWLFEEGQDPRQVTDSGDVLRVRLGPDGRRVAFTRLTGAGTEELWAADGQGEHPVRLAAALMPGEIHILDFSADSQLLAFTWLKDGLRGELWVAPTDGSGARRLVSEADLMAIVQEPLADSATPAGVAWIPGTHTLVYDAQPQFAEDGIYLYIQNQVWAVDADTGEQGALLTPGRGGQLSFSPDGTQASILTPDDLRFMDAAGSNLRASGLDYFAVGMGEFYFHPIQAWSPDSRALVVAQPARDQPDQTAGPVTLWRVPADGSVASRLAEFAGFAPSFAFSPDRRWVTFWSTPPASDSRTLHLAAVDGSEQLAYDTQPLVEFLGWSPDSQRFLYWTFETKQAFLGHLCQEPVPLRNVPAPWQVDWLDSNRLLWVDGPREDLSLFLTTLPGDTVSLGNLDSQAGYDFALLPPSDQAFAQQALLDYFAALSQGDYAAVAARYGGDYEVLAGWNPDLPAGDPLPLWARGCESNGLVCGLKVGEILEVHPVGERGFRFTLTFLNPDGSLFELGPCCGADPDESPPQTEFEFNVGPTEGPLVEGRFVVLDLPVYVP